MPVEVFKIARRKNPPGADAPNLAKNFVIEKKRDATLDEFISNPNLSLYALDNTAQRAVFVSTPTIDRLTQHPFLYRAQYDTAEQVWLLNYEKFHQAADKMPAVGAKTLFIFSVGRCGSTLLSRIFHQVDKALSLSEPDVFTQIAALRKQDQLNADAARSLLRSCWKLLTTARTGCRWLVVKLRSEVTLIHDDIMTAVPEAFPIFMYRNAEAVIASYDRIWGFPYARSRWLFRTPLVSSAYRAWRRLLHIRNPRPLEIFRPVCSKRSPVNVMSEHGLLGYFMLEWLAKVNAYLALRERRRDTVAVRYEDLVNSPRKLVRELFQACGIPDSEVGPASAALGKDSQEGTPLARAKSSKYGLDEKDLRTIRHYFANDTPYASTDVILPGTLTHNAHYE